MTGFEQLRTLDDVKDYVREAYRASGDPNSRRNRMSPPLRYGFTWGSLPLALAEPGPLIEHAIQLGGADGLTLVEVRGVFDRLGKERLEQGLSFARHAGRIEEARERRPNRAGRPQEQVVLRRAPEQTP